LILPVVAVVSSVQDTATVSPAVIIGEIPPILDTSALIDKVFVVSLAIVQVKSGNSTVIIPAKPGALSSSTTVLALANTVVPSTSLTVGMAATT